MPHIEHRILKATIEAEQCSISECGVAGCADSVVQGDSHGNLQRGYRRPQRRNFLPALCRSQQLIKIDDVHQIP
jgi:hypothetical protein